MLDICLAGTGGTMPLKNRRLASAIFRSKGKCVLIDCGEGTQVALKEAGFTFKPIDVICLTHFHADHTAGLPGLLLSMGNEGRAEPVTVIGPIGTRNVVNSLRVIAPGLPFELEFIETDGEGDAVKISGFEITAFRARHTVPCLGYALEIKRAGKFDVEKARRLGVPLQIWSALQKTGFAEYMGSAYTGDMVLGESRRGIKAVYCTDTRPVPEIAARAEDADILICEGMYGDRDKQERAEETGHMMFHEAAQTARAAGAKRLWLTHYSPSLEFPEDFIQNAAEIFPDVRAARDGDKITIKFEE